jgi:hypothetical protein
LALILALALTYWHWQVQSNKKGRKCNVIAKIAATAKRAETDATYKLIKRERYEVSLKR